MADQTVWQIGDDNGVGLALYPDGADRFLAAFKPGVGFRAGADDPALAWPYVHPGPVDEFGGEAQHSFAISFDLPEPRAPGYRLTLAVRDSGPHETLGTIALNGCPLTFRLDPGADRGRLDPDAGLRRRLTFDVPAGLLKDAGNELRIWLERGSWFVYDFLRLERLERTAAPTVSRFEVESTALFRRVDSDLRQALLARVEAEGFLDGRLIVEMGDHRHEVALADCEVFDNRFLLLVPAVDRPTPAAVTLRAEPAIECTADITVSPARRWRFFILHHTHFDLGFTDRQDRVWEMQVQTLDDVIDYCDRTADWAPGARFAYIIEGSSLLQEFMRRKPHERVDRMLNLIRAGRVEVMAFYSNLLTELCGHEELIRGLYFAGGLRDRHGVAIRSAMINDIPGYTWAIPELLTSMGVEYLNLRANYYRGKFLWYRPGAVPRPFMWRAPSGREILTWYTDSYRECNSLRAAWNFGEIMTYLRDLAQSDYALDIYPLRMGGDNNTSCFNAAANARRWNEMWEWPKLVLATNAEFYDVLKSYGPFPGYAGDAPDWWADGACSSAHETGTKRVSQERLLEAEKIFTWLHAAAGAEYPAERIDSAYEHLLLYDEHTWGHHSTGPDPLCEETREQWEIKASFAHDAHREIESLHSTATAALGDFAGVGDARTIAVCNAASWPRTDLVTVDAHGLPAPCEIVDAVTGNRVPAQATAEGGAIVFPAREVPAHGYKVYRISPGARPSRREFTFDGGVLSGTHYRLTFDPRTGAIRSLVDRDLGAELVDPGAEWAFNQFIYESENGRVTTRQASFELVESGPHRAVLQVSTVADHFPRIVQTVMVHREFKRIDLLHDLTKEERLEREAAYLAFPFAVGRPQFDCEITDAIMRPEADQLPLSCRDFYSIQHWVRLSGDGPSILWATVEAPLVEFGDITTERWADRINIDRSHLYVYLMNNHWRTNYKPSQGGDFRFRFSLASRQRPFSNTEAVRFGWEVNSPLMGIVGASSGASQAAPRADTKSFCAVEPSSVIVTCLKRAADGRGLIARLWEVEGRTGTGRLRFDGIDVRSAHATDLVERDAAPLRVVDGIIEVPVRGFGISTVRVQWQGNG